MAVTDARVKFLRGQLANLPTTKVDGNVYVATDERSMYVDYKDGSGNLQRIRLGDFLEFANWTAIENQAGSGYSTTALYYAEQENILGKWTGTTWKQINAQKSLEQMLDSMSYNITTGGGSVATIKLKVTGTDNIDKWANALTYKLTSLNPSALRVSSSTDANGFTNINLRAKDAVLKHEIEVNTRTYDQNDATLSLYAYESGTDSSGTALSKPATWGNDNLAAAITFTGVGQTHVASNATNGTISISTDLGYGMAFNSSGVLTLTVTDLNDSTTKTATITPVIRIGQTGATADYNFQSGIATLPVYTISQTDTAIENAMKAANAMTFKGTLGTTQAGATINSLPLTANTVKIGDTYKVISASTYIADNQSPATTYNAVIGDMFIATSVDGTETNGYIDASKIRWVYIPSGNEDVISNTITYTAASKKFHLSADGVQSGAAWAIGSGLDVDSTGSGSNQVVTIKHAVFSAVTPAADANTNAEIGTSNNPFSNNGIDFTAITGLTLDNGHITGIKTGTFKVGMQKVTPSLNGRLINSSGTEITASSSATSTRANIQSIITYDVDNTSTTSTTDVKLSSETLTFRKASASADLQVDLLWETF